MELSEPQVNTTGQEKFGGMKTKRFIGHKHNQWKTISSYLEWTDPVNHPHQKYVVQI